ncbi:Imm21 family immunity protein [Streptomyces sp. NPDC001515]
MGGPLIVIPVSALDAWRGCTESGMVVGDGVDPDDYDRACAVDDLAGAIAVGGDGVQALVLGDEPATTCYMPEHHVFLRWLAADSETGLKAAAEGCPRRSRHPVGELRDVDHGRSRCAHGLRRSRC